MGNSGNDRRIDNIEFTVSDIARSREFYGKAFGWTFTDYGSTYCEFSDGRLTGGFAKGDPMSPGGPLVILNADDLSRLALKTPAQGSQTGFHLRSRPKSRPYRARWRALLPRVASALAFPSTRILLSLSPGPLAYLRVRFHALTA